MTVRRELVLVVQLHALQSISFFFFGGFNYSHKLFYISAGGVVLEASRQFAVGMQISTLVKRPDFFAIIGHKQIGGELGKIAAHVIYIPLQHALGVVVACCVNCLG